jgi:replicative DNA helicase
MSTATAQPAIAVAPPFSQTAEESIVGQMLAKPELVAELVGTQLEPRHFYVPACRTLYHSILDAWYADDPRDPLTIGEICAKQLAKVWRCGEDEAVERVRTLAQGQAFSGSPVDHARIVRRDADYRAMLELAASIQRAVANEEQAPDELAASTSQTALEVATSSLTAPEVLSFDELGPRFIEHQRLQMAARAQGLELGAYFGLKFLDNALRGLRPTEVLILAGEPGVGKSAVGWAAIQRFAERQMRQPPNRRIGALVLSLEMGEEPSNVRLVQANTGLDGGALREGRTTEDDLKHIIDRWQAKKGLPLYFNFTSSLPAEAMRAMVIEQIQRRRNVGVVLIDHMRYFSIKGRFDNKADEDEAKAQFLKERIAKDLNVAVICLAHTTKAVENREDRRPRLSDLRGGGMVAAHADAVGFVYRPFKAASARAIEDGTAPPRTDAELIWEKARHAPEIPTPFHFDPSKMDIRDV